MENLNQILVLVTGFLIAVLAMGAIAWVVPALKSRKEDGSPKFPHQAEVEEALKPILYQAIAGAFKFSEIAMENIEYKMTGLDKKAIADAAYALIPNKVGQYDITLIKALITPERFSELVQNAYDEFLIWYNQGEELLDKSYSKWLEDNPPPATPPVVPTAAASASTAKASK